MAAKCFSRTFEYRCRCTRAARRWWSGMRHTDFMFSFHLHQNKRVCACFSLPPTVWPTSEQTLRQVMCVCVLLMLVDQTNAGCVCVWVLFLTRQTSLWPLWPKCTAWLHISKRVYWEIVLDFKHGLFCIHMKEWWLNGSISVSDTRDSLFFNFMVSCFLFEQQKNITAVIISINCYMAILELYYIHNNKPSTPQSQMIKHNCALQLYSNYEFQ